MPSQCDGSDCPYRLPAGTEIKYKGKTGVIGENGLLVLRKSAGSGFQRVIEALAGPCGGTYPAAGASGQIHIGASARPEDQ